MISTISVYFLKYLTQRRKGAEEIIIFLSFFAFSAPLRDKIFQIFF
jgi:hypothetical protein